ncbi:Transcription factor WhiB [uncultured Caudovirales phage]|uniref:Transcription factor WhiB n=1 Tax=uncultured Caudovirales phage TaxID=2100421 RepID=A0A6J5L5J7_9CAUD|nr:Transcription factor WhiB [uncultured Caudovirales phage]
MLSSIFNYLPSPEPWEIQAKCGEQVYNEETKEHESVYDPELWFPPRDKKLYKPIADKAKSICYGKDGRPECPVRLECLAFADKTEEAHGIWGGMSHRERNALKRKAERLGTTLLELAKKSSRQ